MRTGSRVRNHQKLQSRRVSRPFRLSRHQMDNLILHLNRALGFPSETRTTPYQRSCSELEVHSFARSYLRESIYSKYSDGSDDLLDGPAKEKFFAAEELCKETNARFSRLDCVTVTKRLSSEQLRVGVVRKISCLLGEFSPDEFLRCTSFSGGASTRFKRRESAIYNKYSGRPESTLENLSLARLLIEQNDLWKVAVGVDGPIVTVGNQVLTVPKNYKTNRTIAKEPCMNNFVQKGLGGMLRERLRKWGIDLSDQTKNQRMAHEGSLTGAYATIDLSMASDTLAYAVVEEVLMPTGWFPIFEQGRSRTGVLPASFGGGLIHYAKYSSMGNAFTFELESLLFGAIVLVVLESLEMKGASFAVYGDDIVVPSMAASDVLSALCYFGFTPNEEKTFISGPFRESCGKHYFAGTDVSPFYVRRPPSTLEELILLHNNFVRYGEQFCIPLTTPESSDFRKLLLSLVPDDKRKFVPLSLESAGFFGTFSEILPTRSTCGRWRVSGLTPRVSKAAKPREIDNFPWVEVATESVLPSHDGVLVYGILTVKGPLNLLSQFEAHKELRVPSLSGGRLRSKTLIVDVVEDSLFVSLLPTP